LEDFVQAGTSAARMGEEEDAKISIHELLA
jgi:hypothetical protein